jgi:hypothetical protein
MDNTNRAARRTIILPPAVETDLLFDATGMDTESAGALYGMIRNAGANPIATITRYQTLDGITYVDPVNYGPLAPLAVKPLPFLPVFDDFTRLTATSLLGTSVEFAMRAIMR